MRRLWLFPALGLLVAGLAGCNTVLLSPGGDLALRQRNLIIISTCLMLLIIVPVIALTLLFAWRYRESNTGAHYDPDWDHSTVLELLIWSAPLLIIIALGAITWVSTHKLDPYRPLGQLDAARPVPEDDRQALTIEVVSLDWKWLFLYPQQGIATVNELVAPVDQPVRFKITSSAVMNSFFVPSMAGQVYAMPGMETKLHAVINEPGIYEGFSANYSGAGFSDMRFRFRGVSHAEFDQWVQQVKGQGGALSRDAYLKLAQPSEREPVRRYATVDAGLYDAILNRCVQSNQICIKDMMAMDAQRGSGRPVLYVCTAGNTAGSPSSTRSGLAAAAASPLVPARTVAANAERLLQ